MKMTQEFLEYSALDSVCTLEIRNAFWNDLKDGFAVANDRTMRILPVLMFMQTRGVMVDHGLLSETKKDVLAVAAEKQAELNKLCGRELNINSSKQCQEYFYGELGIEPYKGKTGKPTVDDLVLQRLVRGTSTRPGLRQAKLVQDIRGLRKLYSTYLNLEFDADSRLRGSYNPRGTKFGRLSSSKTIFGTGMNFQNLPPEFKKFLVPDPGYVLMEVDKRQAEWVAVAYMSGDANMLEAIITGRDVHTHTAHLMFDVDPEIVLLDSKIVGHSTDAELIREVRMEEPTLRNIMSSRWPRTMSLRQCGKKSNHGLNYDEGFNGFAMINEIEIAEAKRIVNMYHDIYPGIRIWYEDIKRMLARDMTLTNCFGRSIRFLDKWGDKLFKSAYSALPQSTIVDGLNQGMAEIYECDELCGIQGMNIDTLAQVHDSILFQVPIEHVTNESSFNRIIELVTDFTSPEMTYNDRNFKIASDFKFGMNWGEHHEVRNPSGMIDVASFDTFMSSYKGWSNGSGTARVD